MLPTILLYTPGLILPKLACDVPHLPMPMCACNTPRFADVQVRRTSLRVWLRKATRHQNALHDFLKSIFRRFGCGCASWFFLSTPRPLPPLCRSGCGGASRIAGQPRCRGSTRSWLPARLRVSTRPGLAWVRKQKGAVASNLPRQTGTG